MDFVMAYYNDGRYSIDNSIAERSIRFMTIERNNKMAFGSYQGVETSMVYHTLYSHLQNEYIIILPILEELFNGLYGSTYRFLKSNPCHTGQNKLKK